MNIFQKKWMTWVLFALLAMGALPAVLMLWFRRKGWVVP